MAGQPQDPSFLPHGQDQTQVRPVWQQPTYTPPIGSPQDTAVFSSGQQGQPGPGGQGQSQGQAQGYPGPSYATQGQGYAAQGYPAPGQQGQQGQPGFGAQSPQWNAYGAGAGTGVGQGMPQSRPRLDGKGFLGSLFDFSFTSFVTPKIVRVIYILLTLWTALWGLIFLIYSFKVGTVAGIFTLVIIEPIYVLLTLGVYRVILEAFVVVFRLYEETKKIREQGERQG